MIRINLHILFFTVIIWAVPSDMIAGGFDGIMFIENKGQWSREILYAAKVPGGDLLVLKDRLSYRFEELGTDNHNNSSHQSLHSAKTGSTRMDVLFLGGNPRPEVGHSREAVTRFNYYLGDKERWASDCRAFQFVSLKGIYEGIDLNLYTEKGSIKYDLVVAPNADPSAIKLSYTGHEHLYIEDGCVFASVKNATLMEKRPVAFQEGKAGKKTVPVRFNVKEDIMSFDVGRYNRKRELIIDPELVFSTFSGSVSDNFGYSACFDDAGNTYSGGIVFGDDFSSTTSASFQGSSDIAILKYNDSGTNLLYGTYIGGSSGEAPHSMVVNHNKELLIFGYTGSPDYPTTLDAYDTTFNGGEVFEIFDTHLFGSDLVVSKLDQNGHLLASTFVGGSGNDGLMDMTNFQQYQRGLVYNYGDQHRGDIIVNDSDQVFIVSNTNAGGFPTTSSIQPAYAGGDTDGVVFSLSDDLSTLVWSTYLGGADEDAVYSIKLNAEQQLVVAGGTQSGDFPITDEVIRSAYSGSTDGFVSIIDIEADQIVKSSFLGTSGYDQAYFIDIDENEDIYVFGQTLGAYPIEGDVYSNTNGSQFIHKLTPDLSSTIFSTVFGSGRSTLDISPTAFVVSYCDMIFLSGWGGVTNSRYIDVHFGDISNMPLTSDALYSQTDGSDFYLMVLSGDGKELLYGSYYGSTNNGGDHVDGGTSRFDKEGVVYQSTCSCGGSADDFPTTEGAWSTINRGVSASGQERCNNATFKMKLAPDPKAALRVFAGNDMWDVTSGCAPLKLYFFNESSGGVEYHWDFGDYQVTQTNDNKDEVISYDFTEPGTYQVTLSAINPYTCINEDITSQEIEIYASEATTVSPAQVICAGDSIRLEATGGVEYLWSPDIAISDVRQANPVVSPSFTTLYEVKITNQFGCEDVKSVLVEVDELLQSDFHVDQSYVCNGQIIYQFINDTETDIPFTWDFGDGQTSEEQDPSHRYEVAGDYLVTLAHVSECSNPKAIKVHHGEINLPNVFTPNNDGKNDLFVINSPFQVGLTVVNKQGKQVYKSESYPNDWDGDDLPTGVYYYVVDFVEAEAQCSGWLQILR